MNLLPQPLAHRLEQCAATTEDNIGEQVLSNVIVALHDRVEAVLVDAFEVVARQRGIEENFGASETLVSDQDFSTVGQLVVLLTCMRLLGIFHCLVVVANDHRHRLFDVPHNLELRRRGEVQAALLKDLTQVLGEVLSGEENFLNCMRDCITFIDRDRVGDTLSRVQNDTSCSS